MSKGSRAVLFARAGPEAGRRWVIRPGQCFKVGRSGKSVTIKLLDKEVSRCHASFELRPDGLYVTDLKSRNGTYMDGIALGPDSAIRVTSGQVLRIGSVELEVQLDGFDRETRELTRRFRLRDQPLLPEDEYEILDEIGSGSMGRVWAARQKLMDRTVAIKVLKTDLEGDARERFLAEGRIWCKIRSPYVVELYDIRISGGTPCLIMELVQGPSAYDEVERGALDIAHALKIGEHVALALEALAEAGVVHRDIKPHNILLAPDGIAKLGDFGIARAPDGSGTQVGIGMGSLSYVAPEQLLDARTVDARTDIFGLGATLYHLLVGRPPVVCKDSRSMLRAMRQIAEEPPEPICDLRPECPEDVARLVHRMLDKDPEVRPQPAAEVAKSLNALRLQHYPDQDDGLDLWESGEDLVVP